MGNLSLQIIQKLREGSVKERISGRVLEEVDGRPSRIKPLMNRDWAILPLQTRAYDEQKNSRFHGHRWHLRSGGNRSGADG